MTPYVLDLHEVDQTQVALIGGKGAQLGALSRIPGVLVPAGFCVTTAAFRRCGGGAMADDVAAAIAGAVARYGAGSYAVRSSATAEDLPTASFAGQHDSFLRVVGVPAILAHVQRCWASLFNPRAIAYRARNGFDHRKVEMAVIVQHMVPADAAGVLFTADPLTGHRKVASIEAVRGLGDALVAGEVTADAYQVRDGAVIARPPAPGVLSDAQAVQLAALGRRIAACFGRPQDLEWCLASEDFYVVQSRPITTLFPIPEVEDGEPHVYLSVGHQQMMTDPLTPLALSLFQRIAAGTMHEAGGRLWVDVARRLASPASRAAVMGMAGRSDPLTGDALRTLLARGDVIPQRPDEAAPPSRTAPPIATDPAIVTALIARSEASLAAVTRELAGKTGAALLDFLVADLEALRRLLFEPQSMAVIMAGIEASWWLNEHLQTWLGEVNAADTLTLSAPHNVTSEMGLALLEVADVVRRSPEVVAFLARVREDDFLDELARLPGGAEARAAIAGYLDRYGMRCVGEIDLARPRWREQPSTLVPMILAHVKHFAPGEAARRFEHGRAAAARKAADVLARLRDLPDGAAKADETARMIDRVRTFIGYREYPKYAKVSRYFVYRQALRAEAARLVAAGVLRDPDDLFYLSLPELHDVVRTQRVDPALIAQRRETFRANHALTPPRVLTSDGEALTGAYRRDDAPPGALLGLAVSTGTVEGRARVLRDLTAAELAPGDILVTTATDPSWTPLFVTAGALVTEVGGLMTHGAVIAREYGLPAVVGVPHATRLIRDGQRIRVHGGAGYVELLEATAG